MNFDSHWVILIISIALQGRNMCKYQVSSLARCYSLVGHFVIKLLYTSCIFVHVFFSLLPTYKLQVPTVVCVSWFGKSAL